MMKVENMPKKRGRPKKNKEEVTSFDKVVEDSSDERFDTDENISTIEKVSDNLTEIKIPYDDVQQDDGGIVDFPDTQDPFPPCREHS